MKYDHKKIETKWQKYWSDHKTFKTEIDTQKPKYYILDMFPYPSGSGLHVGHLLGYTATDILARYKRQKGFNVLHPMGWDSFGLPAEQYAIRTGTHPAETTQKNIENFKRQLKAVGYSYDWDREITTSDPSYYKWTQWIFTKLYEKGLAYEAEINVNYCPALGTVLANEEVDNGRAKEGGHPVERRPLRQWILRITEYAERLIEDLDLVDWPESLKKLQINWIGKSEGANITFPVENDSASIRVFTTRADTLWGATFLVLAPEHPLVDKLAKGTQKKIVEEYQKRTAQKSDLERTDLNKEKTGVFTGSYAINPVNGEKVPIWVADYVMMGYGMGAVMAVPAHDERDFAFAKKYALPIRPILEPIVSSYPDLIPEGMSEEQVKKAVLEGNFCWSGEGKYIHSANKEISIEGLTLEEAKKRIVNWLVEKGVGEFSITYKLRDWLFSRQRYWGEPFPIIKLEDGTIRLLDVDELPLMPPEVRDFKPAGDAKSPLSKVSEWVEIIDQKTGKKAVRETNTMPQWAGSCWYYLRFADPHNTKEAWSKNAENYWLPVDLYVGGVEHAVLHLLYARFWHKVLYDCGYVHTPEPFQKLRNQGMMVARSYQNSLRAYIAPEDVVDQDGKFFHSKTGEQLSSQIDKMSKSKLNGITPDEVIEEFGADSLRLYEMFMGPLEKEKLWNTEAVTGCRRFLNRFYDMVSAEKVTEQENEEALKLGYRLVHGVTEDIEALQFNTAIAKMMEFLNEFTKLEQYPKSVLKMAILALSPFAPHIAEEMWELLGSEGKLAYTAYPKIDPKYLEEDMITYIVQVNGKVRGRFDLPKNQTKEKILEAAKQHSGIARYLEEGTIDKVVFVPNKLLNIVIL